MSADAGDYILRHYDEALRLHGDTIQGAHWPNEADLLKRYQVMLEVIKSPLPSCPVFCDLACGTGGFYGYLKQMYDGNFSYIGVDRSRLAIRLARQKFPAVPFHQMDVSASGVDLSPLSCDFLICNGLFTVKWNLSQDAMWRFLEETITRVWPVVRCGIAFNVMSKAVDWERDDLFHVPMDHVAALLHRLAGRNIVLRADYGLYEYTAYAWKRDVSR
jgi:SAM-dependent methyltransferase